MTPKEHLVELIQGVPEVRGFNTWEEYLEGAADYLIDNGVKPVVCCCNCLYYFNFKDGYCGKLKINVTDQDYCSFCLEGHLELNENREHQRKERET